MHDPPCILVADDNETNRDILVTRLEAHGYQTLQAADGEEALRGVAQHRPDVVLLDVMMPNLDGTGTGRWCGILPTPCAARSGGTPAAGSTPKSNIAAARNRSGW
jgi:DNA-binding NtrC family response regulator